MSLTSNITKLLLFVLFFLSAAVPLSRAQDEQQHPTKTIVVIGTSAIYKGDSARARETAVARSLVSAVDMVALEILHVDSIVRNFKTINAVTYAQTGEFIQGYKVLTESASEKQYRVMVQATVSLTALEEKLSEAGIVVGQKALPKVLFLVAEQHFEDNVWNYWWGQDSAFFEAISEVALSETLAAEGFSIIDHLDIMLSDGIDTVYDKPDLNDQEIVAAGNHSQAEVVIAGKSTVYIVPNVMGTKIRSYKGTVTARAIRTDTGTEIASTVQSAVTANSHELVGSRKALSTAGVLAAKDLASQIESAWLKEDAPPGMVEIVLEGTGNLANFVKFRSTLKSMPGVKELQVKEMKSDQAIIVVSFQGNAKELADALILKTFDAIGINIYEVSENHLRIGLVPGS